MMHKAIDHDGQELTSAKPTHPGVVLAEELEEREIIPSAFALELGTYPNAITEVIKGNRNISAALALKLEKALGISAGYWMRLQANYELNMERQKQASIA
ncbi:HigA family addiction module antitoxin [Spirosoma areae]